MSEKTVRVPYYPGCTMKTKALGFERSAMDCAEVIGFEMDELKDWNCCGASYPLTKDNLMGLTAPTNILVEAERRCQKEEVDPNLLTLCVFCYNTLKRTEFAFGQDEKKLETINAFLDRKYEGSIRVIHYLEYLRDVIGFDNLAKMVKTDMSKYKVAPYYGCLLLKPQKEIGLDDPEDPVILHNFLDALGCKVIDFPAQVDCCGSYLVMREPEKVSKLSYDILADANEYGAETLVTACPLCQSNLDQSQGDKVQFADLDGMPVLYFTQLLAIAFGLDTKTHLLEEHHIDPRPLFEASGSSDGESK